MESTRPHHSSGGYSKTKNRIVVRSKPQKARPKPHPKLYPDKPLAKIEKTIPRPKRKRPYMKNEIYAALERRTRKCYHAHKTATDAARNLDKLTDAN